MTSLLPLSSPIAFALSLLVKASLVLSLTAGLAWGLRKQAAVYRHATWALGLSVALLLPVAEGVLPQWAPPGLSLIEPPALQGASPSTVSGPAPEEFGRMVEGEVPRLRGPLTENASSPVDDSTVTTSPSEAISGAGAPPTEPQSSGSAASGGSSVGIEAIWETASGWSIVRFLVSAWAFGSLVVLGWGIVGLIRVRWRVRAAERLSGEDWREALQSAQEQMGVSRSVRLYRSSATEVPMTAGFFRPVILLPSAAEAWETGRRRTVLLHELAHVKRGDFVTNVIAQLACAVHWVNPMVWWAARRLRAERERACDDRVLAAGVRASDYSEHLVALAREIATHWHARGALSMARPSRLEQRVRSILSTSVPRSVLSRRTAALLTGVFLAVVVPLLAFSPDPTDRSASDQVVLSMLGESADGERSPLFNTENIRTADQAADRLRAFHHQVDYTGGYLITGELLTRFPDSERLWAWHALSLAQEGRADSAAVIAERLRDEASSTLWKNFGIAAGLQEEEGREQEIRTAARRAAELAPDNPEVAWLKAEVLWETGKRLEAAREAYQAAERMGDSPLMYAKAGYSYAHVARMRGGVDSLWQRARTSLRRAREMDSTSVPAFNNTGMYYEMSSKPTKAYKAYRQAARHSTSPNVHASYWEATRRLPGRSDTSAHREIRTDIEALKKIRPVGPNLLYEIAGEQKAIGDEEQYSELKAQLLSTYPRALEAQWIQINAIRDFRSTHRDSLYSTPALTAKYRQKLWSFIESPHHPSKSLLGEAYRNLFFTMQDDSTVSADTLLQVVEGMAEHEEMNPHIVHALAPTTLAERGIALEYASTLARDGISEGEKQIRDRRSIYDTKREFQRALAGSEARYRDALGWVHFHDGQLEKAKRQLQKAYSLTEPYGQHGRENVYHLGRLYEKRGDVKKAQEYYAAGLVQEGPGSNPNKDALKRIYRSRNGDLEGYEAYLFDLREEHRVRTRKEILATREEEPESLPAFSMQTLEGDSLSSDQLEGQVTVINFWGKWCGPCVEEMPAIQKLYEKYRDTPEVRVLTIDHQDQVDELRSWISEREFTFPVLIDRGYVQETGVNAFPTTWFVTPEGEIAFVKEGMTRNLVQEFTWRIEALRGG